MPDALATIITSAGVAAIVSSAALAWNGWRERLSRVSLEQIQESHQTALRDLDRKHEAELPDLDREHESRLQQVADLRALRDLKVERLRTNLAVLTEAALKLGDREFQLRMEPLRFTDPDPALDQARTRLNDVRPVLLLPPKASACSVPWQS